MEKEKLFDFTDKIVECLQHKNAFKQLYKLQKVIEEIWEAGSKSKHNDRQDEKNREDRICFGCGFKKSECRCSEHPLRER